MTGGYYILDGNGIVRSTAFSTSENAMREALSTVGRLKFDAVQNMPLQLVEKLFDSMQGKGLVAIQYCHNMQTIGRRVIG